MISLADCGPPLSASRRNAAISQLRLGAGLAFESREDVASGLTYVVAPQNPLRGDVGITVERPWR
jgi:hypothetical protein